MGYSVLIVPAALKQLQGLGAKERDRVRARIDELAADPRPPGCVRLQGGEGIHRVRAGDYRVLYTIEDSRLLVLVVRVGHRGDVYRRG